MAQAEAILQQRIDCLERKLTAKQLEELKSLVRMLGFELKPTKADKPNYRVPLCPSNHPADIAAFYASK